MKTPDPFDVSQFERPPLSKAECSKVADFLHSDTWQVIEKVLDWQANALNLRLIHADEEKDSISKCQGQLIGFALAKRSIHQIAQFADSADMAFPEDIEHNFFGKWMPDKDSGY